MKKTFFHLYLICNIFDRHPKTSSICSLDTIFNFGFKRKELDIKLLKSLDISQEYAFIFGSLIGLKLFFKPKLIASLINSIAKYSIQLIFSVLDFIYLVLYSIYYICNRKNNKLKSTKKTRQLLKRQLSMRFTKSYILMPIQKKFLKHWEVFWINFAIKHF